MALNIPTIFNQNPEYDSDRLQSTDQTFLSPLANKSIEGGTEKTGVMGNMWDNNSTTAFVIRSAANADQDQKITFDMGRTVRVKSLFTSLSGGAAGGVSYTLYVSYSKDNSTWTHIRETATSGTSVTYYDTAGNFNARYIRLFFDHTAGTNAGSGTKDTLTVYDCQIWV